MYETWKKYQVKEDDFDCCYSSNPVSSTIKTEYNCNIVESAVKYQTPKPKPKPYEI